MAAVVTLEKIAVAMKLNIGTSKTGLTKTASVALPALNKNTFDADKALNIIEAVIACLSKSLNEIVKTDTSSITPAA